MTLQRDLVRQTVESKRCLDALPNPEIPQDLISPFLALPELRGFWPTSSFDENGDAFDLSGQGRILTYNGDPEYNYDGLAPYINFDGTGDWLSRADEAGLDILGTEAYVDNAVRGLTLGGWFYIEETGTDEGLITKDDNAAQRSYALFFSQFDRFALVITDAFLGQATVTYPAAPGAITTFNTWYFVVGRFDPGVSVDIFVNQFMNSAITPRVSINNSGSDLVLGAAQAGLWPLQGRASLCFLCAAFLSDEIISSLFQQTRSAFRV